MYEIRYAFADVKSCVGRKDMTAKCPFCRRINRIAFTSIEGEVCKHFIGYRDTGFLFKGRAEDDKSRED